MSDEFNQEEIGPFRPGSEREIAKGARMEEPDDAPKEPTFRRLNEMGATVAACLGDDEYLQVVWPVLPEQERAGIIRTVALVRLLFDREGHQRLLDKLHTDHPALREHEDEADTLATTAWFMGAATVLRYLRKLPKEQP